MNFSGIASGLSAMYPGYVQGEGNIADLDIKQAKLKDMLSQIAATAARGRGMADMFGGMQQGQQPMGGQPGQPSMPAAGAPPGPPGGSVPGMMPQQQGQVPQMGMQRPGQMPGGPMQGMPGAMPQQPQPQAMGGPPQGNMGQGPGADWRAVIQAIQRANPGLPPEQLAQAVDQYMPMMNQQARQEWQMLSMQLRQQQLDSTNDYRDRQLDQKDRQIDQRERGVTERAGRTAKQAGDFSGRPPEPEGGTFQQAQFATPGGREPLPGRSPAGRRMPLGESLQRQAIDELTQELNREPNAREISKRLNEIKSEGKNVRKSATEIKEEGEQRRYSSARSTIADAISDLKKGYSGTLGVSGLTGKAATISEIIANIAGWSDRTTANSFKQKIEMLRTQLPRMLSGRSQIAKDERERINRIIPGLEPGSTAQITFDDLTYLDKKLGELSGQGDRSQAGTALKPVTPEILQLMDKARTEGHSNADIEKHLRDLGYDPAARNQTGAGGGEIGNFGRQEGGGGDIGDEGFGAPARRKAQAGMGTEEQERRANPQQPRDFDPNSDTANEERNWSALQRKLGRSPTRADYRAEYGRAAGDNPFDENDRPPDNQMKTTPRDFAKEEGRSAATDSEMEYYFGTSDKGPEHRPWSLPHSILDKDIDGATVDKAMRQLDKRLKAKKIKPSAYTQEKALLRQWRAWAEGIKGSDDDAPDEK